MSLTHIIDGTAEPVTVTTASNETGSKVAVTTWPNLPAALAYANRISDLCGGRIVEVVA